MDTLDLHVEQRVRFRLDAETLVDQFRQRGLVMMLDAAEALLERGVAGVAFKQRQPGRVVEQRVAADLAQEVSQAGIGQH